MLRQTRRAKVVLALLACFSFAKTMSVSEPVVAGHCRTTFGGFKASFYAREYLRPKILRTIKKIKFFSKVIFLKTETIYVGQKTQEQQVRINLKACRYFNQNSYKEILYGYQSQHECNVCTAFNRSY